MIPTFAIRVAPDSKKINSMSPSALPSLSAAGADLALSDLALNAAIELEQYKPSGPSSDIDSVVKLATAISEGALTNLELVPVYDRALSAGAEVVPQSKNDLYSRLQSIAEKMQSTKTATPADINDIRDFCVALHEALLTSRIQQMRQPASGQKRLLEQHNHYIFN